jgi:hypothetical protein
MNQLPLVLKEPITNGLKGAIPVVIGSFNTSGNWFF